MEAGVATTVMVPSEEQTEKQKKKKDISDEPGDESHPAAFPVLVDYLSCLWF